MNTIRIRWYTLFLHQDLVDFSTPIVVETNGKTPFEGVVEPNFKTLLEEARHSPATRIFFSAKLTIDVPYTNYRGD